MDRSKDKISDQDLIAKVDTLFLQKKSGREKIKIAKKKYEPSPFSRMTHILYPHLLIDKDNIERNFSYEIAQKMIKGNRKLIRILADAELEEKVVGKKRLSKETQASEKVLVNDGKLNSKAITEKEGTKECAPQQNSTKPQKKPETSNKPKGLVIDLNLNQKDVKSAIVRNNPPKVKPQTQKQPEENEKLLKNKTGNTTKKYNLGLLQQNGCFNAETLNKNYIIDPDDNVQMHLYTIEIVKKDKYLDHNKLISTSNITKGLKESFGIITPQYFGAIPCFKLLSPLAINEKMCNIEHMEIKYIGKKKAKRVIFNTFIDFHRKLFEDIYTNKDSQQIDTNRLFTSDKNEERKYLIIPLKLKDSDTWQFDIDKINTIVEYQKSDYSESRSVHEIMQRLREENKYSSEKEYRGIVDKALKKHVFFTDYKFNLYFYQKAFYMNDNSKEFFKGAAEVCSNRMKDNEIPEREQLEMINCIKVKYFKLSDVPVIERKDNRYLILKSDTSCEPLIYYRKLKEKFNLQFDIDNNPIIMVLPVKSVVNENFTYNCHFNMKRTNHSFERLKVKYKTESSIYPILPVERTRVYFLLRKQWKFAMKLPSILCQFERFALVHQLTTRFLLLKQPLNVGEISHFAAALTSPAMMEDLSYETLETLGDSVLKFIITYQLFDRYPNKSEGDISSYRTRITKNNYLFERGRVLTNYIFSTPINVKNWDPPLKFKHPQKYDFSLTKKNIADVLEGVMGACFLSDESFNSCLSYLKFIDLLEGQNVFSEAFLAKLGFFDKNILFKAKDITIKEDISFIDLYNCFAIYYEFEPDISLNSKEIKDIGSNYAGIPEINSKAYVDKALKRFEEKCLNYSFKDKTLLHTALTHKSYNSAKSYERLEILGDAILEIYIMATLFHLCQSKGTDRDSRFCPGNLSKTKAYISSNYFLLRLSVFFKFHEYLLTGSHYTKHVDKANKCIKGINFTQRLNEYEGDNYGRPKIISDIFESVIGAIFIDSDINQCFKFLNMLVGPFIFYCSNYLGNLKYSPIAEFVEVCQDKLKAGPSFKSRKITETEYKIEILVSGKAIAKGHGYTEDSAKESACINGIKTLKLNEKEA